MGNKSIDLCDVFCVHHDRVDQLKQEVPQITGLEELFKALSDQSRLKIVYCLLHGELCGCDLAHILQITPAAVSHHLRILRHLQLVKSRRDGKLVYYSVSDEHVQHIISQGLVHWQEGRTDA